jgi:hemerythrin-like metal-binding protein
MAYINWSDSLSVKVSSVDEQHKKLFDLINSFYEGISQNQNKETMLKLIMGLKSYTVTHFTHEERLLRQAGYPDFNNHKKQHEDFIKKVNEFQEKYTSGKLILSLEVTGFIKTWITEHIMKTDKMYVSHLTNAGIK